MLGTLVIYVCGSVLLDLLGMVGLEQLMIIIVTVKGI